MTDFSDSEKQICRGLMYQARLIKNRDIKMSKVRESQLCAGGVLLILIILSFSLACLLTTDTSFTAHTASSLLSRLLGESRQSLGDYLDLQADRYFHRGVPHIEKKRSETGVHSEPRRRGPAPRP